MGVWRLLSLSVSTQGEEPVSCEGVQAAGHGDGQVSVRLECAQDKSLEQASEENIHLHSCHVFTSCVQPCWFFSLFAGRITGLMELVDQVVQASDPGKVWGQVGLMMDL